MSARLLLLAGMVTAFRAEEAPPSLTARVASHVLRGAESPGEWGLAEDVFALLGMGQVVLQHPEQRAKWLPAMEAAADHLLAKQKRAFATRAWGSDGFDHLDDDRGDAWIGWVDLGLSMLRAVEPENRHAALNDRMTAALTRRLSRAPHGLIATYPGVAFPADVSACIGAIALHAQATHSPRPPFLERWSTTLRDEWVDPKSGYLWQRGDPETAKKLDAPRGSGTALAAYFLLFADPALSRELTQSVERHQTVVWGLTGIREYGEGHRGKGDIDSGPVVAGVSATATAFSIGPAVAHHRKQLESRLRETATALTPWLMSLPQWSQAAPDKLGNAILLSQLTATDHF